MADIEDIRRRLQQMDADPRRVRQLILGLAALVLVVLFAYSSWFTVNPEERGVVLRLGKWHRTVEPGLHLKLPYGLDVVDKVPVRRQLKEEFGFRTTRPGVRSEFTTRGLAEESEMLTGGLNVASVEWVTQYRITEPRDYLFKVRHVTSTFRDMNEAVMREVVGDRTINEVLTTGRTEIEGLVQVELQDRCRQYEMGVTIDQVILQDVNPPDPVKPAFNEVNQAQQEKEKLINEARAEYNKIIPKARGDAEKVIEQAKGYAVERVNQAQGEAKRFNDVLAEYIKAPQVTRRRLYLETMEEVLAQVGRKVILDEVGTGVLPLLNLDQGKEAR